MSKGNIKKNGKDDLDKKSLIIELKNDFSSRSLVKNLAIKKSTFYDHIKENADRRPLKRPGRSRRPEEDEVISNFVFNKRQHPFFINEGGYKKLSQYLFLEKNIICNHKRMYRICKAKGFLLERTRTKKPDQRRAKNIEVIGPNQLWQFDIKYGHIHGENRFFYICAFIDVFDRGIRGYHIGLNCKAQNIINTLKIALKGHNIRPEMNLVLRSDNGPQMTSNKFFKAMLTLPAGHEFIPPGEPNENAYIESFNSLLEMNVMRGSYFLDFASAYRKVVQFINFYQTERIHGSLKTTPDKFKQQFEANLNQNYAVSA